MFFFRGVYCIELTQPSVMFCSGFIIFINPLDILTLLMYDNFPIQKMNKLRTSQPHENLISVWKYLPVKTCIIQKPKPVKRLAIQISWHAPLWHTSLLNGISQQTIETLRRKQNLLICMKKNINDEVGRHLWKSNVAPDSCVFPDMPLLQGCRNGFQSVELWNIEKYLLVVPWLTYKKKIWILDKKALKKFKGRGPCDRPSSPLFPLPSILLALHCYVSYGISFCFKVIIFSGCIKSWSWNVLWSYEAMELPRKWIEFVNERIYIFKIVNYEYFALKYITKMFLWKINILCTLYIHLCTCVYICIDIHSWYIHIYIYKHIYIYI